jgi:hypothetical protein
MHKKLLLWATLTMGSIPMFAAHEQDNLSKYTKAKQFFSSYITHGVVSVVGIGLGALLMRYSPDETSKKAGLAACSLSGYSLFHSILRRNQTIDEKSKIQEAQLRAFGTGLRMALSECIKLKNSNDLSSLDYKSPASKYWFNEATEAWMTSAQEEYIYQIWKLSNPK